MQFLSITAMIRPLRTIHFLVWRVWVIIIPLAFAFALIFRPAQRVSEQSSENLIVQTSQSDSVLHIAIKVLNPITAPSCVVYAQTANQKIFLGRLSKQGVYTFTSLANVKTILLYDAIHKKEIETIVLKGL